MVREEICRRLRLQVAELKMLKILSAYCGQLEEGRRYLDTEKELIKMHNQIAVKCQYPQL